MTEAQSRTEILIGAAGLARLRAARVLVAGLGGVGAYVAEALGRAGIGHLTLLDHDVVAPSNLNRQLLALHSTLGRPKVAVMAARLHDIDPTLDLTLIDAGGHQVGAIELAREVKLIDLEALKNLGAVRARLYL